MKKLLIIIFTIPVCVFGQTTTDTIIPNYLRFTPIEPLFFANGDTVVNLNSLNGGIQSYQISDESKQVIAENGLEIKDGGVIVLSVDSMIKKPFIFDVKIGRASCRERV